MLAQEQGEETVATPEGFVRLDRRGLCMLLREPDRELLLEVGIGDPRTLFSRGEPRFKGRGRPVSISLDDGTRAVLRPYRHGGLLRRITGDVFAGRPRPLTELLAMERARRGGVRVPVVLAAVWEPVLGIFHRGWILTRQIEGARDLAAFLAAGGTGTGGLLLALGRETKRMHEAGVWHADLHVKNVLTSPEGVTILDFDRAEIHDRVPERRREENLLRFDRSLVKRSLTGTPVRRTDRIRFFRGYYGEDPGVEKRRELVARCRRSVRLHRVFWSRAGGRNA